MRGKMDKVKATISKLVSTKPELFNGSIERRYNFRLAGYDRLFHSFTKAVEFVEGVEIEGFLLKGGRINVTHYIPIEEKP